MSIHIKLRVAAIVLVILFNACKSNESILLRLNYAKDEEQRYSIDIKYYCSPELHVVENLKTTLTVDSVSKNHQYYLTSRISAIKTDINLGGFLNNEISEHFDSEKNGRDMDYKERELAIKYDSIMQSYYQLAYNDKGEVAKPFSLNGKIIGAPFAPGLVQVSYPDKKVKVGDSWKVNLVGPLASSTARFAGNNCIFNYSVKDITADKVFLDVSVKMQSKSELVTSKVSGLNIKGVYIINRKNGRIESGYLEFPQENCEKALISITTD